LREGVTLVTAGLLLACVLAILPVRFQVPRFEL
jgi:hypothetical protein